MNEEDIEKELQRLSNKPESSVLLNKYFILAIFSILPVANFTAFNINEVGFSLNRAIAYLLVVFGLSLTIHKLLVLTFPKTNPLVFSFTLGFSIFITFYGYLIDGFVFGSFFTDLGIRPRIMYVGLIYLSLLFLCISLSFLLCKNKNICSIIVVGFSAFALSDCVIIASSLSSYYANSEELKSTGDTSAESRTAQEVHSGFPANRPNVYFILPDMMFGPQLFEIYNIEPGILDGIRERGFDIVENAFSNAPVTEFSIPHIFTMKHYLEDGMVVSVEEQAKISSNSRKNNLVVKKFQERGYSNYAVADGYINMCSRGEYKCLSKTGGDKYQTQDLSFIERTPFFKILNVLDMKFNIFSSPMNLWPYPNRMEVPELISFIPLANKSPYFMYIHLGLPHYPLRFDRDCNYKRFSDTGIAYAEQYRCSIKYLELLIDTITEKDPDGLIVMHADHGVMVKNQHLKQVEELSESEIIESLSIMSAFKLPQQCRTMIRNGITPVNTFRLVFACLDNTPPDFVEDRSFLVYYPKWPSGGKVREWHH